MAKASQPLLDKLAELNATVLDVVSDVTPAELEVPSAEENWPLGLLLAHIALGYQNSTRWLETLLAGQPITVTPEQIFEANDKAEADYTGQSVEELLGRLKDNMAALQNLIDGLTEEQLNRKVTMALVGGKEVSPFSVMKVLQGHTLSHLDSFKMTLASVRDEVTS